MKTKCLFFFAMMLCSLSVFAQVVDNAGLLNPSEKALLEGRIAFIALAYKFDLVILTERDIGGSWIRDYADDFFDYNGYGFGKDRDGCILLQVTGSRDYWFSTSGRAIMILNDAAGNKLETDVVKFLGEGNVFKAYQAFLQDWEMFLELEAKGRNFNFFQQWNLVLIIVSWAAALLIGFIITMVWKSKMNTVKPQIFANSYVVPNSLFFNIKNDRFLYSTVSKVKRQTQPSDGSGIHTGSSGISHGGRGGKY